MLVPGNRERWDEATRNPKGVVARNLQIGPWKPNAWVQAWKMRKNLEKPALFTFFRLWDHPGLVQGWESVFLGGSWFLRNPKDSKI